MASFCVLVFAAISYNDPMEEPETASVARQGSLPRGNRSVSQTSSFCLTFAKCSQTYMKLFRGDEAEADLEELMVMEAIWLSMQV